MTSDFGVGRFGLRGHQTKIRGRNAQFPECIDNLIANMANSKSYDFDEVKQRLIQLGGRTDDNDDDDDSASSRDEVLEEELDMCTGAMGASSASSIEHGGAPIGVPSPLRAGGAPR